MTVRHKGPTLLPKTTATREPAHPGGLAAYLHVGRPEREVVAQELHDERAVLVRLLPQRVQLCDGLVEGLRSRARTPTHAPPRRPT